MGLLDYLAQYAPSYPQVQGALQSARESFVPERNVGNTIQSAMNMLPMGRLAPTPGIKAYHGSPYNFDRFDASKIGTGEGAQSYGRGLYFAEKEPVAQSYRDALSPGAPHAVAKTFLDGANGDFGAALTAVNRRIGERAGLDNSTLGQAAEFLKNKEIPTPGHMYEVNINAKPEQFLDWDKPLNGQSPEIQTNLKRAMGEARWNEFQSANAKTALKQGLIASDEATASTMLNDAGIPGIKYLDQGSRSQGQGTNNYVVFNDGLIDIMRKYGLAGAIPFAGAAAPYFANQPAPIPQQQAPIL